MTDTRSKQTVARPCWTITPTAGRSLDLAAGWWQGEPAVAMFVGRDHRPIILTKPDAAELMSTMVEILEGAV